MLVEPVRLEVGPYLVEAATNVLQTMFFIWVEDEVEGSGVERSNVEGAGVEGPGAERADAENSRAAPGGGNPAEAQTPSDHEAVAAAEVRFHGAHSGRFRLVLPESTARVMAANFSGIMDAGQVTAEHTQEVLGEFANMVCGATLSRLAPQAVFSLETPRWPGGPHGTKNADTPRLPGPETGLDPVPNADPGGCTAALSRRLITDTGWMDLYWCWEEAA